MRSFKYCPQCGHKDTVKAADQTKYACSDCSFVFWNSPIATVSAVFMKGDEILFAKRGIEPNKGKYDFPGGFLEYNEDLYEGCTREILEETGLEVHPTDLRLVAGYAREYLPGYSVIDLILVVKKWPDQEFTAQDDVAALEWKSIDFIDNEEFAPSEYVGLSEKLAELQ